MANVLVGFVVAGNIAAQQSVAICQRAGRVPSRCHADDERSSGARRRVARSVAKSMVYAACDLVARELT